MNTINFKGSYKRIESFINGNDEILFERNDFNVIIKKYFNYLNDLNQANYTIQQKLVNTYLFFDYLEKNKISSFKKVERKNIYNYVELYDSYEHCLSYKDRNKLNIKLFLNWTYSNNYSNISGDMTFPKIVWHLRTNIKTYYTKEEITKLLNIIDRRTKRGKEDYLIISLICYLGLRISDVVNLKISDINFNENTISIIQYKTNERLTLPLIDEIKYAILDYLKNVRPKEADLDFIFITNVKPYKHHIELKRHSYIVKSYFIKSGVDINGRKAGFHSLRHSFSTMLLNENVPLYSISTILGHSSTDMTFKYLDIDTSKLKELALEVPIC